MGKVAIVGRPNVGKSTLMNRILGSRKAITEKTPGVTRDKREELANWAGYEFKLLDTGGWTTESEGIQARISKIAMDTIEESDMAIFVVDGRAGITSQDSDMAKVLNRLDKPVLLAVNKIDDAVHKNEVWNFLSLGLGEPFPISALHGRGVADLLDMVIQILFGEIMGTQASKENQPLSDAENPGEGAKTEDFAVSIVGRPNVGKSTLFNRLVGSQRSIESDMPGTTRDPVDTITETEAGVIRYVDTAGMRRKSNISARVEYYAMLRALESVDRSDIALLVVDAEEGVTHQDQRLAERIDAAGCPILILLNKWDLCDTEQREKLAIQVGRRLHFIPNAPLLRISALTGAGINRIIPALSETLEVYRKRVSTREINKVIAEAQYAHSPPDGGRILYAAQVAVDPPTFVLFVNKKIHQTYLRYLEKQLRESLDYGNTPLKIRVRLKGK